MRMKKVVASVLAVLMLCLNVGLAVFAEDTVNVVDGEDVQVTVHVGDEIKYIDYGVLEGSGNGISSTNYFTISPGGKENKAYCLQALWGEPSDGSTLPGKDAVESLKKGGSESLQKVLYYGYAGPGDVSAQFFTAETMSEYEKIVNWDTTEFRYLMTHCAASYAYYEYNNSWSDLTGNTTAAGMDSLSVACWGMTAEAKTLVKKYFDWLNAMTLPDRLLVNDAVADSGMTGDNFELTGRTGTETPIGLTFTVPEGWLYKSGSTVVTAGNEATSLRQNVFQMALADSAQVLNPTEVPTAEIKGTVNGSPDESWRVIIALASKGDLWNQDIGGISYSALSTSGSELEFSVTAKTGSLTINKTDGNDKALEGAKFGLYYDEACTKPLVESMESDPLVTDANGKIEVSFLLTDTLETTNTVYVKELAAPAGYALDKNVYTVELEDGSLSETLNLTNKQQSAQLCLTKVTADDEEEPVSGAKFGIYTTDDELIDTKITDENGIVTFDQIDPFGKYYVKELFAPMGYTLYSDKIDIDFSKEESSDEVVEIDITCKEEDIHFDVEKVDEDGNPIADAAITLKAAEDIYDAEGTLVYANGDVIDVWESDGETSKDFGSKVFVGASYELVETEAPVGYAYAESVKVEIELDGTILADDEPVEDNLIRIKDKAISFTVNKVDAEDNSKDLEGAELVVLGKDEDGEYTVEIDRWISTKDEVHDFGGKLEAGESYILREVVTPDKYESIEDIAFSVNADGSININVESVTDEDGTVIYLIENQAVKNDSVIDEEEEGSGEEDPGYSDEKEESKEEEKGKDDHEEHAVKTGDNTSVWIWGVLMLMAAVVIIGLKCFRSKRK